MKRQSDRKKNSGAYQAGWRLSTNVATAAGMERLGGQLAKLSLPHIWLLRGPLGAGKTTFVRGVLRSLGIRRAINSPTFNLVKQYSPRKRWTSVVHIDAYRLTSPHEIHALGLTEALAEPKTLILVEWPERLSGVRWPSHVTITLAHRWPGRSVVVKTIARPATK